MPAAVFISFECKGPVSVELHFADPVSGRKISDRERHHGLDNPDWKMTFAPDRVLIEDG
jgi:hypothetical protein